MKENTSHIETIHERIAFCVKEFGEGKNTVFALNIGVSEGNIRGYIKGVVPKADVLEKIVRYYDIDADWLLTGRGEMCKSKYSSASTPEDATPIHDSKVKKKTPENQEKSPLISELLDTIKEQAETIGRLKARIEDLENQIADPPCEHG